MRTRDFYETSLMEAKFRYEVRMWVMHVTSATYTNKH
jgi:hypothetical protein